jgi:hypothetical protein
MRRGIWMRAVSAMGSREVAAIAMVAGIATRRVVALIATRRVARVEMRGATVTLVAREQMLVHPDLRVVAVIAMRPVVAAIAMLRVVAATRRVRVAIATPPVVAVTRRVRVAIAMLRVVAAIAMLRVVAATLRVLAVTRRVVAAIAMLRVVAAIAMRALLGLRVDGGIGMLATAVIPALRALRALAATLMPVDATRRARRSLLGGAIPRTSRTSSAMFDPMPASRTGTRRAKRRPRSSKRRTRRSCSVASHPSRRSSRP